MIKKIAVITGNRADYGLLKNVLRKIQVSSLLQLQLIVTGSHLSPYYGYTIEEIRGDGFQIDEEIDMLIQSSKKSGITKAMGIELMQMADVLERLMPDLMLVLGDRYEIFIAATAAVSMNIPIAHIAGGEISYGAIDEQIRHAITKMAHIHFPEAEVYASNIRKMGEESWRVHQVGALGIENIESMSLLSEAELINSIGIKVDLETILMTYHPATLDTESLKWQMDQLLEAITKLNKKIIITYPNPDNGGQYIINRIEEYEKNNKNIFMFKNLGVKRYLSVMARCGVVIGNSSSALIEAPYLKVPVVNIGNRQEGRLMAGNIICSSNVCEEIVESVNKAMSQDFRKQVQKTESLYGVGKTSELIVSVLEDLVINHEFMQKRLEWR